LDHFLEFAKHEASDLLGSDLEGPIMHCLEDFLQLLDGDGGGQISGKEREFAYQCLRYCNPINEEELSALLGALQYFDLDGNSRLRSTEREVAGRIMETLRRRGNLSMSTITFKLASVAEGRKGRDLGWREKKMFHGKLLRSLQSSNTSVRGYYPPGVTNEDGLRRWAKVCSLEEWWAWAD